MHEQIEALLGEIGTKIQDAAVSKFDGYVYQLTLHLESFRSIGGEVPVQFMLRPAFHDLVRSVIKGRQLKGEDLETKLANQIAADQVGFAIQDYRKDTE